MLDHFYYYWVKNITTGETVMHCMDSWSGDIGENFCGKDNLVILDYAEEIGELEMPEDF